MTITDNLVGILIVGFALILGGVMFSLLVAEKAQRSAEYANAHFIEDKFKSDLNSFLLTENPATRWPYGGLVASAAYYRTSVLPLGDGILNITNETEAFLDALVGQGKYYGVAEIAIAGFNLHFILDPTAEPDLLARVNDLMQVMVAEMTNTYKEAENFRIRVQVDVLAENTTKLCDTYNQSSVPNLRCVYAPNQTWVTTVRDRAEKYNDVPLPIEDNAMFFPLSCEENVTGREINEAKDELALGRYVVFPISFNCNASARVPMEHLANASRGEVIDLARIHLINTKVVRAVGDYFLRSAFVVGLPRPEEKAYGVQKRLIAPSGKFVRFNLRVYPEIHSNYTAYEAIR